MIPKIIHYCWLSNDPVPQDLQTYMLTWKEKLPDYEFILWNFDRFDKNSSKWVAQAFDNKKYAFAADYIRLYAVYNYGGFYMDMDIEVLKSFDDLLDNQILLAYEDEVPTGIEAGVFGAEKNNPIIKECLDYYSGRNFIKDDGTFDTLPLPRIMTKYCCGKSGIEINDRFLFTCKSFKTGIVTTKPFSYTIHHFAGSWLTEEQKRTETFRRKTEKIFGDGFISRNIMRIYNLKARIRKDGFLKTATHYINKLFRKKK